MSDEPRDPVNVVAEALTDASFRVRGQDLGTTGAYSIVRDLLADEGAAQALRDLVAPELARLHDRLDAQEHEHTLVSVRRIRGWLRGEQ